MIRRTCVVFVLTVGALGVSMPSASAVVDPARKACLAVFASNSDDWGGTVRENVSTRPFGREVVSMSTGKDFCRE